MKTGQKIIDRLTPVVQEEFGEITTDGLHACIIQRFISKLRPPIRQSCARLRERRGGQAYGFRGENKASCPATIRRYPSAHSPA